MRNRYLHVLLILLIALAVPPSAVCAQTLHWQSSSGAAFALARREHRFVILDLEAVWCHWCHVMDQKTYANAEVRTILNQKYVALRVDQDANPALSARYGDWGWPATIVFAADGSEIVKRRGYIEPQEMIAMLKAIIADPSPGPSINAPVVVVPSAASTLDPALHKQLLANYVSLYDKNDGGWGEAQHFIDAAAMELAIELARGGDANALRMAQQTLDQNLNLIDPVWGGVDQYSVGPGWKSPHYEKIMAFQADDMRLYALAYANWHRPEYLKAARAIGHYLTSFLLSPEGAFYVSQDADLSAKVDGHTYYALDDAARRKLGIPKIDTHLYARENGWVIAAMCQLHDSLGDARALDIAKRAAQWVLSHRALPGGGFRHDQNDAAGSYLADNIAMAQALLSLYRSTGERSWLTKAETAFAFIDTHYRATDAGYFTAPAPNGVQGVLATPIRIVDENIALARAANMAYRVTGDLRDRTMSEYAMRFLIAPMVMESRPFLPGLILADRELSNDPIHIAIVGGKDDPAARALDSSALGYPEEYLRVDWWDRREGPLPNPDVTYPKLAKAAAFVCTGNACSLPVYAPQQIAPAVDRLRQSASK
ncbi:MAG: thioredoxin domain-containing protein [Rudaea sp.]